MNRRDVLIGSGTAAAIALAGCLGSARTDGDGNPSDAAARTIAVTKSGEVEAEPDLARLSVGIESSGDSAAAVRDDLSARSEAVREALLEYGLEEDDVTTGRFDIRERVERYRETSDGPDGREEEETVEERSYYRGSHSLSVEIHDVDAAGEVIDVAVDAGADAIGRVEFTLSDEKREELREAALERALDAARAEADFVAAEVGAEVVEAKTIATSDGRVNPIRADVAFDDVAESAPATELHPDDVTVRATVDVKYRID